MRISLYTLCYLIGLAVLFLNDWFWKYAYGNFFTGKLSDFLGLFLLGLFLVGLFPRQRKLLLYGLALFFVWWKTPFSQGAIDLWNTYVFFPVQRTVDYTDYVALLVLPIADWLCSQKRFQLFRKEVFAAPPLNRYLVLSCSVFVFSSTSMAPTYYTPGDILIEEDIKVHQPLDSILGILRTSELTLTQDSLYLMERDTAFMKPYYQLHDLPLGYRLNDTISVINFYLHPDSKGGTTIHVLNLTLQNSIELQDWKKLKSETKEYKRQLQQWFTSLLEQTKPRPQDP